MCGRITFRASGKEVAVLFALAREPELRPRYNISPTQTIGIVRATPDGGRELVPLRWGLIPSWAKDPAIGARCINARAETAAEKPAFRTALRKRRCLIPVDGFYEWTKGGRGKKQAYHIRMADGRPFALAGLWEEWHAADGEVVETFTILTTEANAVLSPFHDRMPVVIPVEHHALWLDPAVQDVEKLRPLLVPYPAEEMTATPVGPLVNNARNDVPGCLEPAPKPAGGE